MSELKVGDVVRLRSGGERMTVSEIEFEIDEDDEDGLASYRCHWFPRVGTSASINGQSPIYGDLKSGWFPGASLEKA